MFQKQKETILALLKSDEANSDSDWFVFADTLIIFSTLTIPEIQQIFNEPKDIFPSDIGELTDFLQDFVVDENGNLFPAVNLFNNGYSAYYCWWD